MTVISSEAQRSEESGRECQLLTAGSANACRRRFRRRRRRLPPIVDALALGHDHRQAILGQARRLGLAAAGAPTQRRQRDLLDVFGSRGIASEVVGGKRAISKAQAKKLAEAGLALTDIDLILNASGTPEQFAGWYRCVEYIPRANAICRTVFPKLLGGVRAAGVPLFHVVGGGSQNGLLCQFTADACHRTVVAGPVGAVVGGLVGLSGGVVVGEALERAVGRAATTTDAAEHEPTDSI